ncbi:Putative AAA+ ATPase domain, tetratricopeptide-like helical domain superfamily [Septoria linicola]|uniref:AAA+ ATPase domain, tetratricopeptide-like helical domain superfamily n=1 Tax=Septoria linicola TaxID=215465 RepID=A0A9Q9AUQ8_9PEZI|nr:putative AAA+ ATPase domain, tetratricopeptide-like helical domain superfamily [Septoria linicola]USW55179.1 Putative AAA+ ATPase domain, tetratricopeptide-like helical domain superfamily [Septoria linicola]
MQRPTSMVAPGTPQKSALPTTNGSSGYFSPPSSPSIRFGGSTRGSTRMTSSYSALRSSTSGQQKSSIVRDTAYTLKRKSASELGAGISETADNVSFIQLVEWIRSERLQSLPHKGSRWDTVLIRALYFAERLHGFELGLKAHASETEHAAHLGYGHIRLLLELGHSNSLALDSAFGFMYRCSSAVSALLARAEVLKLSSEVYQQLCLMYTDLLTLVVDVAVRFYRTVHGSEGQSASLDMYEIFGETITTFRQRREDITKAIWKDQIEADGAFEDVVDVDSLSRWLAPQDRILATLSQDHTLIANDLAEFTGIWFLDDLSQFVKSDNTSLLVNGPAGSGKTTLAAALAERLQRPVARKPYTTAFCSVGAVPSQANSLNVVKALLHQIYNIRVGNVRLYQAVVAAYERARYTADPAKYEDLLWDAFEEVLRSPLQNAPDLVLIVEGIDEVLGGQPAGQALLQRLVHAVEQGKGVKLIALAQNLKLPTGARGTQRGITETDTKGDIHEVVIKTLIKSQHFRATTGREQESLVEHIISVADGNFLWAELTSEVLRLEKSPQDLDNASDKLSKPKLSVDDLTHILITRLQPTEDAKLLLSWLVNAARPMTWDEIESLFAINVQNVTRSERRVDIHSIVSTLAPLLDVQEDIIRPRHPSVQNATRNLLKAGKITLPSKDPQHELLLRVLTYAKISLTEKGEPTLDDRDRTVVDYNFTRHPLLEYVVRYYPWHLHQAGVVVPGKATEPKITPDLQKVFPESTTMAILEWICWDAQYPGAQEVEVHDTVRLLRTKILGEKHPAVLQSYINTACYWEALEDYTKAGELYYPVCSIGRTILSVSHPIVVESAVRYIRITDSYTSTTRTEIITRREQTFILLISAYERQFGMHSEVVIRTRERLVELYIAISEEEHAREILKIIHGHTEEGNGATGGTTRGVDERFVVKFGKHKHGKDLEEYDGGIFIDDEKDEDALVIIDVDQADIILREIQEYIKHQEFHRAEQTYVELWQRLSETCRTSLSVEWHEKKIQVVQSYSQYLHTQKRTVEAKSLTTSIWREYEHHELSFSEKIVTRLTESARFLKSVGEYSAALSIFKHASYYYKSVRKEESRSFTEIEEEMTVISNQALIQATKDTHSTSSTSSHEQYEMFHVLISNKSKSVETSTLTLAKTLTARYIEEKQYSQAISVIHATLERTWSSFLSKSVHEVTIASSFHNESVELVERLAEVYILERRFEKAEDVYVRLFRASLTTTKNTVLLEKSKTLIIDFYHKRGHPGKIIAIYQELLAVYRRTLGPTHETTITILYELGSRCRAHARSHPYWIEYYQQIVLALNKESTTVHVRAFDAIIIVVESYWEERRYSDAVATYAIIWNTFVQKHKEFKYFSESKYVSTLYERYYQCLEETKADYEVLRQVTTQYRETTKAVFGATSTIAIEATVALARVTQRSEAHMEESIALYEEASRSASKSESSSSSSHFELSELRQSLTTLYKKRIFHSSSSSASSETVAKAVSMYQEQFSEHKSKYSYSHEETLSSLRELSLLYVKQQKTELAVKELKTAVITIVQEEKSSERMYESAVSLVQTYQATGLIQQCTQIVEELHYQLVVREKRSSSSFSVIESSHASLFFLAVLEYHLRKDLQITLSEIMASLTAEAFMYSNFKQLVKTKAPLDKLLLAAAPLRHLLRFANRSGLIAAVDHECVEIFKHREASSVQLLSKESPQFFIVGILEHIANRRCTDFVRAVILASNATLKKLVDSNQFADAHDIAKMTFMYAQHRKGYRGPRGIARGFELASYLDGRGENKCPDPELRKKLLQLSNKIVKDIIAICREDKINFAQVPLKELNELIALLGEQQDYDTLEMLLTELWTTREAQKKWAPEVLLLVGRRLICARYLAGRQIKALRLAEDIAYNLRRVNGVKHPATLNAYGLLAELYTSIGQNYQKETGDKSAAGLAADHFRKAIIIHEDILRRLHSDATGGDVDGDDDDDDSAAQILAEHGIHHDTNGQHKDGEGSGFSAAQRGQLVKWHLRLLKLAYQRFGGWPKDYKQYESLNAQLFRTFAEPLKGLEGVEKWQSKGYGAGKAESNEGAFQGNREWEIISA